MRKGFIQFIGCTLFCLTYFVSGCGDINGNPGEGDAAGFEEDVVSVDTTIADAGTIPDPPGREGCGKVLATIRDFENSHPDFGSPPSAHVEGLVESVLGADNTPVFRAGRHAEAGIAGQETFEQWYRDTPGVNLTFMRELPLAEAGPGVFIYDDANFFPIDGVGFGMSGPDGDGNPRNFYFTTEIHTEFEAKPGQAFTFRGDDDVWIFIDRKLVADLGGRHSPIEATVNIDDLALVEGETYPMDVFHAERARSGSNFRMETTIECLRAAVPF